MFAGAFATHKAGSSSTTISGDTPMGDTPMCGAQTTTDVTKFRIASRFPPPPTFPPPKTPPPAVVACV